MSHIYKSVTLNSVLDIIVEPYLLLLSFASILRIALLVL